MHTVSIEDRAWFAVAATEASLAAMNGDPDIGPLLEVVVGDATAAELAELGDAEMIRRLRRAFKARARRRTRGEQHRATRRNRLA